MNQEWRQRALCSHPAIDPNTFVDHINDEGVIGREARLEAAAEWCMRCPVRNECYAEGIADQHDGVWGGYMMPWRHGGRPVAPRRLRTRTEKRLAENARQRAARAKRNEAS